MVLILTRIEIERIKRRITKKELCEQLGVSQKTYYNWIHGHTDISATYLLKIKEIFGVSIDSLLDGEDA